MRTAPPSETPTPPDEPRELQAQEDEAEAVAAGSGLLSRRALLRLGIFVLTALGLYFAVQATPVARMLEPQWVDEHIKALGVRGWGLYVLLTMCFTSVGGPRQLAAFLGGYAFGIVGGTLLALLGCCLGGLASFSYARFMGRGFVQRRLGERLQRLDKVLARNPVSTIIVLRFLPFTNNMVTNLAVGVSSMPLRWFITGTCIGYLPQTLLFALLGSGIKVGAAWQVGLSIALFAASLVLGTLLLRKYWRAYRNLAEEA